MTDELTWSGLARSVTWPELVVAVEDIHARCTAYMKDHPNDDTVPGAVGMIMAGAIACYPALKSAIEDSRGYTKRPPRAVVEAILTLQRQARQTLPD